MYLTWLLAFSVLSVCTRVLIASIINDYTFCPTSGIKSFLSFIRSLPQTCFICAYYMKSVYNRPIYLARTCGPGKQFINMNRKFILPILYLSNGWRLEFTTVDFSMKVQVQVDTQKKMVSLLQFFSCSIVLYIALFRAFFLSRDKAQNTELSFV